MALPLSSLVTQAELTNLSEPLRHKTEIILSMCMSITRIKWCKQSTCTQPRPFLLVLTSGSCLLAS